MSHEGEATPAPTDIAWRPPGARRLLHGATPGEPLRFAGRAAELAWELTRAAVLDAREALRPAGPMILRMEEGAAPQLAAHGVALYVHYAPGGAVSDMVRRQLAEYGRAGFAVVFITVAESVPEADWQAARAVSALAVHRRNAGRDLGAWRDLAGEALRRWPEAEELLLVNDSVLGPFRPLAPIFAALRAAGEGVFGLVESLQGGAHLQSWFLLARGARAVRELAGFLTQLRLSASKWRMVQRGEIALTPWLLQRGVRVAALYGYARAVEAALADPAERARLAARYPGIAALAGPEREAALRRALEGRPVNPSHHLWRTLVTRLGCPFVKTELVRRNPWRLPDVSDWPALLSSESPCTEVEIAAHLRTMGGADRGG